MKIAANILTAGCQLSSATISFPVWSSCSASIIMHCCVVSVVVAVSVVAHRELLLFRRGCRGAMVCALRTLRVLHSTKNIVPNNSKGAKHDIYFHS